MTTLTDGQLDAGPPLRLMSFTDAGQSARAGHTEASGRFATDVLHRERSPWAEPLVGQCAVRPPLSQPVIITSHVAASQPHARYPQIPPIHALPGSETPSASHLGEGHIPAQADSIAGGPSVFPRLRA